MSLRTALLVLAFVPGIALVALWAVTSGQTFLDFQRQAAQGQLAEKAGQPSNLVYYNLQEERRLSAEVLARQRGAAEALAEQRVRTDEAVETFRSASDVSADDAPAEVLEAVSEAREAIGQLPAQRSLVDGGDSDQQEAVYRYYTDLIAVDLRLFTALSHVDNGRITTLSQPLVDLFWAKEMISRTDALLARGWGRRELGSEDLQQVRQAVSAQSFLHSTKVVPFLPDDERAMWQEITGSQAWKAKTQVESTVLRPADAGRDGAVPLTADRGTWRAAMDTLTPELEELLEHRTALVVENGKNSVISLLLKMVLTTVVGLIAVIAVIWTTWRLTRSLRRRISSLQAQAEALQKALPDVVERLANGERIDVEAEARAIEDSGTDASSDELAQLGKALNLARTSALAAAVKQADQHRGFERLLQRIARRTQQLIGQQLKRLDELERRHEDPEVLDGLFDLDHLTARLRRYEENLVILAGGTPHRRWRKPVAVLDVMRSAQGEVQDYQRVVLDLDGSPWLAARAVGPVSHVLAELIENALSFSRPPSPVEVRAASVSRGLAIEVEDRGLGMEEDQLAEANELMLRPPRLDLLAHSDDIRLGLQVIARLASQYGLRVEFRSSAYGGTRVVVLVPHELTVSGPDQEPAPLTAVPAQRAQTPEPAGTGALPSRVQGRALAEVTALNGAGPYGAGSETADGSDRPFDGFATADPQTAAAAAPFAGGHTGGVPVPPDPGTQPPFPAGAPDAQPFAAGAPDSGTQPFAAPAPDSGTQPFAAPAPDAQPFPAGTPDAQPFPAGTPDAQPFPAPAADPGPQSYAAPAPDSGTHPYPVPGPGAAAGPGAYEPYPQPRPGYDPEDDVFAAPGFGAAVPYAGTGHGPAAGAPLGAEAHSPAGDEQYITGLQPYTDPNSPAYAGGGNRYPALSPAADHGPGPVTSAYGPTGPSRVEPSPAGGAAAADAFARPGAGRPAPGGELPAPGTAFPPPAAAPGAPAAAFPPPGAETPLRAETPPGAETPSPGGEPPLPRRVRQASLVDELRVDPAAPRPVAPAPRRWQDDPLLRPVPRRAGATIGAFQRRSRAARATGDTSAPARPEPGTPPVPPHPTREERS
ncbi:nitrate- and nitrite sensing domain-containing protein [Streptomyces sp. t39]|uniref:nitrate- and nitrite sensing domain-containing protein n=1 Tax=Streptomyces sp. t39 TaxID=1828156 RepID=UPI0021C8AE32|nr:nitrate- and nitrite sensing domain-containing protein [Streptomyces sp. t39]